MNIAIIGTGNMGKALIGGLKKAYGGDVRIAAWDKIPAACEGLGDVCEIMAPNEWTSRGFVPDALILAVKPADIPGVIGDIVVPSFEEQSIDCLVISIAAGVSISSILKCLLLGTGRVCRVMPNTPMLVSEGVSGYSLSDNCTDDDAALVEKIFGSCGMTVRVTENLMDAVTGLSGSGPAFVYSFIEALSEGGVSAGLPYKTAQDMALQTVIGAAKMVMETGEHPSVLRSRVMSPGGTTVAGLQALERGAFKSAVMNAVTEAAARSKALGRA